MSGTLVDLNGIGAYANYDAGYSTIWANDADIFLGTFSSGIKNLSKSNITTNTTDPIDISAYIMNYLNYPDITSDNIRYLHGNNDKLLCITDSGIDVYKMHPQAYRSTSSESNAYKGFMTSKSFYYTTSGVQWSINRVNTCLVDWAEPDYSYIAGSGILASGIKINDIYVTEGTSADNVSNTLFIATSSGVAIIDEFSLEYIIYYYDNIASIWADPISGLNNGKVYISTSDSFNIVNLETNIVEDYYTEIHAGKAGETLQGNDIVDINVV
jgi:hypothetical protein